MAEEPPTPLERLAESYRDDAAARLQYQHEYTLAGLKTLIWINGGAIIGLLTYAGNASDRVAADQFGAAFTWYVGGLASAVLAYLTAYSSQASFMQDSTLRSFRLLGIKAQTKKTEEDYQKAGTRAVIAGVVLAILSLVGFGVGSSFALRAVTQVSEGGPPAHSAIPAGAKR